jgi:predicted XRE-type DNA-binding protein
MGKKVNRRRQLTLQIYTILKDSDMTQVEIPSRFSQAELQTRLHELQPKISDFMRGKIAKFSLETLLNYADRLKMHPQIRTTDSNNKTHLLEVFAAESSRFLTVENSRLVQFSRLGAPSSPYQSTVSPVMFMVTVRTSVK